MPNIGERSEKTWVVSPQHLASSFGSGLADVLATPVLIGFCEEACRSLVDPFLGASQQTVGTSIQFEHTAATPAGMTVTIEASITQIERRKYTFQVVCRDDHEPIGHGTHTRFVVDTDRFAAGVERKRPTETPTDARQDSG